MGAAIRSGRLHRADTRELHPAIATVSDMSLQGNDAVLIMKSIKKAEPLDSDGADMMEHSVLCDLQKSNSKKKPHSKKAD